MKKLFLILMLSLLLVGAASPSFAGSPFIPSVITDLDDWPTTVDARGYIKTCNPPLSCVGNTISCPTASGSQAGCLSSGDFTTFANKQSALGFTPENAANKNVAGGYCPLDGSSLVPLTNIPTNLTGKNVGGLLAPYVDWNSSSGGSSILNKPSSLQPSGSASGDLSGSYPSPTVSKVNGAPVPVSKTVVGTNSNGQIVDAGSVTLGNNTTGNAATATALAASPTNCSAGNAPTGVNASGVAQNCTKYSPFTPHETKTLASNYGCDAGWQSGALASDVAVYVAAGYDPNYILCVSLSSSGSSSLSPTGFIIAASLGLPVITGQRNETISPTGFVITASLGTPIISAGVVGTVSPSGMTMTASLGTPTITGQRNQTLTPTGMALTAALGTPTISGGSVVNGTVTPMGISMTATLGTATITGQRNQTLTPSGLSMTASMGTPTVSGGGGTGIATWSIYGYGNLYDCNSCNAAGDPVSCCTDTGTCDCNVGKTGYVVNDTLYAAGGNNGAHFTVTSVDGLGGVTGLSKTASGTGYSITTTDLICTSCAHGGFYAPAAITVLTLGP